MGRLSGRPAVIPVRNVEDRGALAGMPVVRFLPAHAPLSRLALYKFVRRGGAQAEPTMMSAVVKLG